MHLMNDDDKHCNQRVNRIIGMTFLEDFDPNLEVDHIDKDRTNNHLSNLRMLTGKKNKQEANNKAVNMCDRNNDKVVLRSFVSMTAAAEYLKTIEKFQNRKVKIMLKCISNVIRGKSKYCLWIYLEIKVKSF